METHPASELGRNVIAIPNYSAEPWRKMSINENPSLREIRISVTGADGEMLERLFGTASPSWGQERMHLHDINVVNRTEEQRGVVDLQHVVDFVITYGRDLSVNLVAAWLYDCIKSSVQQMRINGKEITVTKDTIEEELNKKSP